MYDCSCEMGVLKTVACTHMHAIHALRLSEDGEVQVKQKVNIPLISHALEILETFNTQEGCFV